MVVFINNIIFIGILLYHPTYTFKISRLASRSFLKAVRKEPSSLTDDQFLQWETEELEIFEREKLLNDLDDQDKSISIKASSSIGQLPSYMEKIIGSFETPEENIISLPASKLPTIAIIGRPNTGKSTLVNRLTDSYKDGAIIHDEAGITRDRTYRTATHNDYNFQVIDTGGIIFDDSNDIFADRITEQALVALKEANVAIMVCDGQQGLQPLDLTLGEWLRKNCKIPMYLAVNKCESERLGNLQAQEFWSLGLGAPYPVSGIHGTGVSDLLDEITTKHMMKVHNVIKENATNIAFIGRPNVGKSSLFNHYFGGARSIVSDIAGTTRDTVDAVISRKNSTYRIIDTAGIRRKPKVEYGAEFFMVNRAFKAIKRSDIVVLILDAVDGIVDQDRILAERIHEEGRSCIIALNKWDLVPQKDDKTYLKAIDNIRIALPILKWAEVILISAVTGQRTDKLLEAVDRAIVQYRRRIPTAILNTIVQEAVNWLAPPNIGSRSGRIYYTMQISVSPPTLVFFCNDPDLFNDNYKKFLERKIRDALQFEGTPLKMIFRGKAVRDAQRDLKKQDSNSNSKQR